MKKTNMLIMLLLSLGLMLTACGSGVEDSNDSIYVPPPLTPLSDNINIASYSPNFVAVGEDGIIVHSDDGTNWNVNESQLSTNKTLRDIAPGSWVAVGSYGNAGFVIQSDDAISLQTTDLFANGIASLAGIASDGNGNWVAVGFDSNSNGIIATATSNDGFKWKIEIAKAGEVYKDVAYGDGRFIAVGLDVPGENGILRSDVDWNINQDNSDKLIGIPLHDVAYDGNGKWFAIGADTFNSIIEFDSNWNILPEVKIDNIELNGIASDGNGNLIAVGEDQGKGIAVTSNNWTDPIIQAADDKLMGVVYDGSENWIAVGMNGAIVTMPTSTPSVISPVTSNTTKTLNAIAFNP
jgi:hypothetical protein